MSDRKEQEKDYGDYEKDESHLDNIEADYTPADAAMDEAIDELDGRILEDEGK